MRCLYVCLVCVDDGPLFFPVLFYLSHDKLNMPTSNRIHIIQALAKKMCKKKNLSLVSGTVNKSVPRQSLVMPNSDPWDRFFHPYLTLMSDSYNTTWRQTVGIEHYYHKNS